MSLPNYSNPCLYVVIPCYNEEEVLPETVKQLSNKLNTLISGGAIADNSRLLFVDDGSRDKTWELLEKYSKENNLVCALKLAHNRGHQNALFAGLMTAKDLCDCSVSIDADLQDDINVIDKFVEKFKQGCEIVYGVRSSRKKDSFLKRNTAQWYYKFLKHMGVDIIYNHADFRLMSSRALEALEDYKEVNLFLRGIVRLIGFKTDCVEYERTPRMAGESKYPLKKMLALAFDGITSFSVEPISFIGKIAGVITFLSVIGMIYSIIANILKIATSTAILISSVWLVCGIIMLSISVVGAYIGKIYSEVKARPKFLVETFLKN